MAKVHWEEKYRKVRGDIIEQKPHLNIARSWWRTSTLNK